MNASSIQIFSVMEKSTRDIDKISFSRMNSLFEQCMQKINAGWKQKQFLVEYFPKINTTKNIARKLFNIFI